MLLAKSQTLDVLCKIGIKLREEWSFKCGWNVFSLEFAIK